MHAYILSYYIDRSEKTLCNNINAIKIVLNPVVCILDVINDYLLLFRLKQYYNNISKLWFLYAFRVFTECFSIANGI